CGHLSTCCGCDRGCRHSAEGIDAGCASVVTAVDLEMHCLSLHDALPICDEGREGDTLAKYRGVLGRANAGGATRSWGIGDRLPAQQRHAAEVEAAVDAVSGRLRMRTRRKGGDAEGSGGYSPGGTHAHQVT